VKTNRPGLKRVINPEPESRANPIRRRYALPTGLPDEDIPGNIPHRINPKLQIRAKSIRGRYIPQTTNTQHRFRVLGVGSLLGVAIFS
jgi:hypothetical protein